MKRIAWILVALFCTVVVQVRPLDGLKAKACCCCHPGACAAGGCCTSTASQTALDSAQSVREAESPTLRKAEAARDAAPFYLLVARPRVIRFAVPTPPSAEQASCVPLFRAHCILLI
jgi:hypothetical protein